MLILRTRDHLLLQSRSLSQDWLISSDTRERTEEKLCSSSERSVWRIKICQKVVIFIKLRGLVIRSVNSLEPESLMT